MYRHINDSSIARKKHQDKLHIATTAKKPGTYECVRTYEGSGWYPAHKYAEQALTEQGASTDYGTICTHSLERPAGNSRHIYDSRVSQIDS